MKELFSWHPELQWELRVLSEALIWYSENVVYSVNVLLENMSSEVEKRPDIAKPNAQKLLHTVSSELWNKPEWNDFLLLFPRLSAPVQYIVVCIILFWRENSHFEPNTLIDKAMIFQSSAVLDDYFKARGEDIEKLMWLVDDVLWAIRAIENFWDHNLPKNTIH